jgi:hypothetical protein
MEGQIEALTGHVAQPTDKVTSHSSGLTGFLHERTGGKWRDRISCSIRNRGQQGRRGEKSEGLAQPDSVLGCRCQHFQERLSEDRKETGFSGLARFFQSGLFHP